MTITLNIKITNVESRKFYKWKNANHEKIVEKFNELTKNLKWNKNQLNFSKKIDKNTNKFVHVIDQIIATKISRANIIQWSKSKFDEKCKKTMSKIQKRRRLLQQIQTIRISSHLIKKIKQRYKKIEYVKKKLIKRTLIKNHKKKVKKIHENMRKIFKLFKWIRNKENSYKIYIFILINKDETKVTNKTKKTTLLIERFFFKSSKTNLSNIKKYEYSKSMKFENLINHEIKRAINDVVNNKISKNDEIENRIITLLIKITNLWTFFDNSFKSTLITIIVFCTSDVRSQFVFVNSTRTITTFRKVIAR